MPKEDTKSHAKNERTESQYSSGGRAANQAGESKEELSEAARKMRSRDEEERREGASELGRVGGQHSHGGHSSGGSSSAND